MTIDPTTPDQPPTMPLSAPSDDTWSADGPPKGLRIRLPIAVATIAVAALVGVWGGAQLKGDNASATVATGGRGAAGGFGYGGGRGAGANGQGGGGATVGTVQSINGNTITITDQQGVTKTITLSSSTTVSKTQTGSASDITPGETIVVRGAANSDGSTNAQSVSIGNGVGGGFPGGGPPPDTASTGN